MPPHTPAHSSSGDHGQTDGQRAHPHTGDYQRALACCAGLLIEPAATPNLRLSLLTEALGCLNGALRAGRLAVMVRQSEALAIAAPRCVAEVHAPGLPPHEDEQLFPDGAWVELPAPIREHLQASRPWAGDRDDLDTIAARLHPDVQRLAIAPMAVGDTFWGSLLVTDGAARVWHSADRELIHTAARLIANAIHRWEVEARLVSSEARLRTILTTLPIQYWMHSPDGRLLLQSDLTRQIWRLDIGDTLDGLDVSPALRALWLERNRRAYAGEPVRDELTYLINGEARTFDDRIMLVRDGPDAGSIVGMLLDITERKAAEKALAASEERFRRLAGQLPAFVYVIDARDQRVVYANRDSFLGHDIAQMSGMGLVALAGHPEDLQAANLAWRAFLAGGPDAVLTEELRLIAADGTVEWVQRRGVWMGGAQPDEALLMYTLITHLKAAEEARRAEERARLEAQKLESLGVLAGGVAHDFNNLLTSILGHAELALHEAPTGSTLAQSLAQVVAGARHASTITNQILTYTGRSLRASGPVALNSLIATMGDLLRSVLPAHARIRYSLGPGAATVEADAGQLRQVILNLVANAGEAIAAAGGEVTIATHTSNLGRRDLDTMILGADLPPGPYVCIEVRDDGEGIDEVTASRVFEPFYSTRFVGRGLGLAVVRGVVQAHRGAIELRTAPQAGTTVRVWLPALVEQLAPPVPAPATPRAFSGAALLIDDEERVRAVAARMLERLGLQVVSAPDGEAGLAALEAGIPDLSLILVDLTMPGMGGAAVARAVQGRRPGLPVVVMSGYGPQQIEQLLTDIVPAAVLTKPFTLEVLRETVARALSAGPVA